ncbi:fatty acid-binding protein-like [Chironomus tepperi]|uniref:fatty acid-binding protein-like n=1 Tax=Chironomus tepperi TaxID=113505 RepID=UPI00391F41F4
MAGSTTSTVELVKEGENDYSFNTTSTFRSQAIKFQPGIEFTEKRMDGQEVSCVITFDGNKMIQEQKGDKPVTLIREFTEEELFLTCKVGNVEAKRWFKSC